MAHAHPCWVIAGVEMVQLGTLHVTGGVHQAVWWVCGDRHSTPEVAHEETKGTTLTWVTSIFQDLLHLSEVDLYATDEIRDQFWWV